MIYTVGEAAAKIGVNPSTLRYYDKEGLLPFVERSGGGIRMFKETDLEWLSTIECLKKTGMPIKEIKTFIDWCIQGDVTIPARLALIDRRRNAVEKQIEDLKATLETLDYKHWYYETARKAGTCDVHKTMNESDIPPRMREIRNRLKCRE